ncbi:MAG TPA: CopD family protein [Burkholderiaceae bacterium]|nr:CopD family protein [Burkholderiaceae bacterium]
MLWVKTFHIIFVTSWFAGLFYLPRIYVNLAMVSTDAERELLIGMSSRLYRFMQPLAALALVLGLWLWLGYGIGRGPGNAWLHAKLAIVILLVAYHFACGALLGRFRRGENRHGHVWYRYFNEVPTVLLTAAVILVVLKPF